MEMERQTNIIVIGHQVGLASIRPAAA